MSQASTSVAASEFSTPASSDVSFGRAHWIGLGASLLIGGVYTFAQLGNGWIPTDDGTLAQSASRVLQGQLPHRDFFDMYSGGMSFYHALAFHLFGVKLISLRYAVFAIFVPAIAAIYYLASRFASPIVAAAMTLLCAAWSLPAYPAAMPSWYNLFFALLGAAAIFRHIETSRPRWLLLAGICGGLSIDVKITGLYFVAAALLFFVFRERQTDKPADAMQGVSFYRWFVSAGLTAFAALLVWIMRGRLGDGEVLHFVLPGTVLAVFLIVTEWQQAPSADLSRFRALFGMAIPFFVGLAIAIAAFLVPYWRAGAFSSLTTDVVGAGSGAVTALGFVRPAGAVWLLCVLPVAALVTAAFVLERRLSAMWHVVIAVVGLAVIFGARMSVPFSVNPWMSAGSATPIIVAAGAWTLWRGAGSSWAEPGSPQRQQEVFLLLALAAVCSLVQFPFAAPIYFHYIAPLPALAALAVIGARKRRANDALLAEVLGFYLLFGVLFIVPATVYNYSLGFQLRAEPLALPVGEGLRVVAADQYVTIVRAVDRIAAGDTLLAFPECPEFYFLTGRRNPTHADSWAIPDEVEHAMQDPRLRVIVINRRPVFPSSVPPQRILEQVVTQFPNAAEVGQFQVRWR